MNRKPAQLAGEATLHNPLFRRKSLRTTGVNSNPVAVAMFAIQLHLATDRIVHLWRADVQAGRVH